MRQIKITAAFFFSISVVAISCSKINDFGNINQNPGATTTPIPSALLTNVLAGLGNDTWDAQAATSGGLTTVCGMYCQYFSETLYTETSNYARPDFNWDNYYAGRLNDLQIIINYNTDPGTASKATNYGSNNNQVAVARILKAYLFSLLTDCYGDLPYTGALQADNGLIAFEAQQSVYSALFKELDDAVEHFDNGAAPFGDILFNGNLTKWKQFANSLHALLALHLSKIDPSLGKEEFNKALKAQGGVFENGVNAELDYPGVNYFNPVNLYHRTTPFRLGVSNVMTGWLTSRNDKRINAYGTSGVGFPYGITRDSAIAFNNNNNNWARILQGEATPASQPFPVMIDAEIYLARAEAAQRGWTSENAAAMYRNGIEESWKYWGVYNDGDFASYLLQPAVKLTSNDILQKICEQEWAAHYPNGPRGWTDWRRTGFPVLMPASASTSQTIPRRFPYGSNEYSTNAANVQDAASRYNVNGDPDSQYGRVWWDKQ